jgi:hypothetical protein
VAGLLDPPGVVDGNDLHGAGGAAALQAAHKVAPDAPKPVDGHLQLLLPLGSVLRDPRLAVLSRVAGQSQRDKCQRDTGGRSSDIHLV